MNAILVRLKKSFAAEKMDKALVVVAVEEAGAGIGRIRFLRIPDASSASLNRFLLESVAPGSIVHTDGWKGYKKVNTLEYRA